MTPFQKKVYRELRDGKRIRWEISGWYFRGKLLRAATQDSLSSTGELVAVVMRGSRIHSTYVVHEASLKNACWGIIPSTINAVFPDGDTYSYKVRKAGYAQEERQRSGQRAE